MNINNPGFSDFNLSHYAIELNGISRSFRTYKKAEGLLNSIKGIWNRQYHDKVALKPTNLKVASGQIVGLVGANGAGKTTLIKLLSGLIYPSSGQAQVLGYKPWDRDYDFLKQMGILLGQKNQLWWDISPSDSYAMLARIYDIDLNEARKRVADLAHLLNCSHVLETQLRRLSLGERMKMEIIGALLHRPKILFLDEPTIGLDVVAQDSIREFLKSYQKEYQPTILLTSHYMDDITQLADQLLLIKQGDIVYQGTVDGFTSRSHFKQKLYIHTEKPISGPILGGQFDLKVGQTELNLELEKAEVGPVVAIIAQQLGIQKIQTEEVDFEEVIKQFLEKESHIF